MSEKKKTAQELLEQLKADKQQRVKDFSEYIEKGAKLFNCSIGCRIAIDDLGKIESVNIIRAND